MTDDGRGGARDRGRGVRTVRLLLWLPLLLFLGVVGIVASGLIAPPSRTIPSRMIGTPLPQFTLPPASSTRPGLANRGAAGTPHLVNIFASWCVPCAAEAPQLMALARAGIVIDAIAIRDRPADVDAFLTRYGNPYRAIGSDTDSHVQLALGSSGVPETFVVDGRGIIRLQHIGDLHPEDLAELRAALAAAR